MSDTKLTTAEAARVAGLSVARLRQLDAVLRPEKIGDRGVRVYRRDAVEQFAAQRKRP